jgi:hypothetical protein
MFTGSQHEVSHFRTHYFVLFVRVVREGCSAPLERSAPQLEFINNDCLCTDYIVILVDYRHFYLK